MKPGLDLLPRDSIVHAQHASKSIGLLSIAGAIIDVGILVVPVVAFCVLGSKGLGPNIGFEGCGIRGLGFEKQALPEKMKIN